LTKLEFAKVERIRYLFVKDFFCFYEKKITNVNIYFVTYFSLKKVSTWIEYFHERILQTAHVIKVATLKLEINI